MLTGLGQFLNAYICSDMTIILKDEAINQIDALLKTLPIHTLQVVERVMKVLKDNVEKEKDK